MTDCTGFPTAQGAKDYATNSQVIKEIVTETAEYTTTAATDGLNKITLTELNKNYVNRPIGEFGDAGLQVTNGQQTVTDPINSGGEWKPLSTSYPVLVPALNPLNSSWYQVSYDSHTELSNRKLGNKEAHNSDDIDFSGSGLDVGGVINLVKTLTNSSDPMVNVNRDVDNTITGNGHCFSDSSTLNRSGGIAYASYDARIIVEGSDSYDHVAPFQNGVQYRSTGSISKVYGYVDSIMVTDTQIGERTGVNVLDPAMLGAASIGTNIGVRVAEQTAGAQNFSIYTDGTTPSYFGGNLTAHQGLQTSGVITISGTVDSNLDLSGSAGLRFEANTGALYDWSLMSNGYSAFIMTNTTGTQDIRFWGGVGFNGVNPITKPVLAADATDLASVITLSNSIRSALISYGLCV